MRQIGEARIPALPAETLSKLELTMTQLQDFIRDIPDFPKAGILYRDITPLLASPEAFQLSIGSMAERLQKHSFDEILAIESRGFIFGAALALKLKVPFHLVRKPGKLPGEVVWEEYALEYGTDKLELHTDVIAPNKRYAIVDDVIATGGTANAVRQLTEKNKGVVACSVFLIELLDCNGRAALGECPVETILTYN